MARFSCIELTTFSKSMGVMCLLRAWLLAESWRRKSGREEQLEVVADTESSEATLVDSSGGSSLVERWREDHSGAAACSGRQHCVSRPQRRQAMFSYRRPSCRTGEHFEKTDQRPNKFSGFLISMERIESCSTRTMGRSAWRGMTGW